MFLWSADDMSSGRGTDDIHLEGVQMTCHPEGVQMTHHPEGVSMTCHAEGCG